MRRNTPDSFWARVAIPFGKPFASTACWPWIGQTDENGYGRVSYAALRQGGVKLRAHVVAWALTHGRLPEKNVLHHCDNPPCCNPAHLYEGDQSRNAQDREDRGRGGSNVGDHVRRYTPEQCAEVRRLAGELGNLSEVARRMGISRSHVGRITKED